MAEPLVDRQIKVLAGLEEMEFVLAAEGAWAPDNGAIPAYCKGGKTHGGLIGYVSVLAPSNGSAQVLLHGTTPSNASKRFVPPVLNCGYFAGGEAIQALRTRTSPPSARS